MTDPQARSAYIKEYDTYVQAGHECRPGHWQHFQSADKSGEAIGEVVDRLFAHLEVCDAIPQEIRDQLVALRNKRNHG